MAANGISTLPTKQARQEAKLALAAANRAAFPDRYAVTEPDLTSLPCTYDGNTVVDNPNPGGLQQGRPWVV